MNFPDLSDSATPEFGTFVTALKEVFHGEPWEDIATYAERAWRACGLGVGLMADAGLRLACWDGVYAHIVLAHGGAVVLLVALGALSATIVERIKARN